MLSKSKYYVALGSLADAALSRVLNDILALDDITEVESHRLSELCKILNALEGLFVEDATQVNSSFIQTLNTLMQLSAFICRGLCALLVKILLSI